MRTVKRTWRAVAIVTALTTCMAVFARPAAAVIGGAQAPDTPVGRSTVKVLSNENEYGGKSCTGTLITTTVVVTAGHCVRHGETGGTSRLPHRRFNELNKGWNDWEHPNRWYPLYEYDPLDGDSDGENVRVLIGVGCTGCRATWSTTATAYAIPNSADVLALKLAQAVPSAEAVPVTPLRLRPDFSRGLTVAGWGGTSVLRTGTVGTITYPCPQSGWAYSAEAHEICFASGAADPVAGDSGGPIYWTDAAGTRFLAGVFAHDDSVDADANDDGRLDRVSRNSGTATFYTGGTGYAGKPLPNMVTFFDVVTAPSVAGTMYMVDHETFGSNERRDAAISGRLGSAFEARRCTGDEVVGVLQVNTVVRSAASVVVDVIAKLFEGTSCSTTDLDGQYVLRNQVINANSRRAFALRVRNTAEGGDYIDFNFTVAN